MPVTIYEHADFQGRSQVLPKGQYDNALGQITIGNDTLSSIKVAPGLVARLYEHWLFRGEFIDIRANTPAITLPWNDRVSSIVVYDEGQQPTIKPYGPLVGVNSLDANSGGGIGVYAESQVNGLQAEGGANGVYAKGKSWCGVIGISESTTGGFGVYGANTTGGTGVVGESKGWIGVYGKSESATGGAGVMGEAVGQGAVGVYGKGRVAGRFEGDVEVTGDIRLLNADCAEDFDICETEQIEPGMVMALGEDGKLRQSQQAYDKRVAGVVSGAGDYKPGIVLDQQPSTGLRLPIALLGKVYCKTDASYGEIRIGDLLTTSPTPGHAMKADDPAQAFGAVIGKALRPLKEGQGLIPVLIALQ